MANLLIGQLYDGVFTPTFININCKQKVFTNSVMFVSYAAFFCQCDKKSIIRIINNGINYYQNRYFMVRSSSNIIETGSVIG